MTDKHVLFGRTQTNKGINGDKSIIKIFRFHGNETIGMLASIVEPRGIVQFRDAGKCAAKKKRN